MSLVEVNLIDGEANLLEKVCESYNFKVVIEEAFKLKLEFYELGMKIVTLDVARESTEKPRIVSAVLCFKSGKDKYLIVRRYPSDMYGLFRYQ